MMDKLRLLPGQVAFPHNEIELFRQKSNKSAKKKVIMVFFIGGVTHAEVSAIRFLNKFSDKTFVIATTQMINGFKCIEQLRKY